MSIEGNANIRAGALVGGGAVVQRRRVADQVITVLPGVVLVAALLLHLHLPDKQDPFLEVKLYTRVLEVILVAFVLGLLASLRFAGVRSYLRKSAPLYSVVFLLVAAWDLFSMKLNLLPLPYFPSPDKVLLAFKLDANMLVESTLHSLRLLFLGFFIGGSIGLLTGVLIGSNEKWSYWLSPVLKVIGPIPATAWIPLALIMFPTSFGASVFLISLSVWFPVTVMSSSGLRNVQKSYFEVARTLGADTRFLVTRVAIPAALPFIFIGLFMGMGMSFLTLIVAEMLGVKAGLGFYISWAQDWADYSKVYAALAIIAVIFSGIISLIFAVRDRVLVWQKGVIKW